MGKTTVIRSFLEQTGRPYLEVNLAEHADLLPVLMRCVTVRDLEIALSAAFQCQFYPGKTILFFDAIHLYPDILTRIKFWADDGRYRYILSGASLAFNWSAVRSVPVGYLHLISMYPMDLEEFIRAQGMPQFVLDQLREYWQEERPLDDAIHILMMNHLRHYLIVGGMPEAVAEYLRSGNLMLVSGIHRAILDLYREDFAAYEAERGKPLLKDIHTRIAAKLQRQNKYFSLRHLEKDMPLETGEVALDTLVETGTVIPAYGVRRPESPLLLQKNSLVKLYFPDVGLLTTLYGKEAQLQLLGGTPKMDLSGIYVNFVVQELHAHEYPLFFHSSRQNGILDLAIEKNLSAVPIMVRGTGNETIHPALSKVLGNPEYGIETAYVLADCNLSREGAIQYLPLYDTMYLHKNGQLPVIDLKSLTWPDI